METITLRRPASRAGTHTQIAGGLVLAGAAPVLLFVAFLMAVALDGGASGGEMLEGLVLSAIPLSVMALGGAMCAGRRWARNVGIPVVALCCFAWVLAMFFVPALVLLLVDVAVERAANRNVF
jgi:hypothetical protein